MPDRIRLTALIGNGVICAAFAIMGLASLGKGEPGLWFFFAIVAATSAFNWYVIRKASRLLSEEEWLHAEIRKAELRKRLAELERDATTSQALPLQPQGPPP